MNSDFNDEFNGYVQEDDEQTINPERFDEVAPEHYPENIAKAKTAFDLGLFSLLGSLASIFAYFVLNRLIYVMFLLPLISIGGMVVAITTIIKDKGLPKAYIGLILSLLGLIPSIICTLLFVADMLARFAK